MKTLNHIPPLPLSSSPQTGKPGHCYVAQVFDGEGKHLAMIAPSEDPEVANEVARVFAASYDMLHAIKTALGIGVDPALKDTDENCLMIHAIIVRNLLEAAYKKATGEP